METEVLTNLDQKFAAEQAVHNKCTWGSGAEDAFKHGDWP